MGRNAYVHSPSGSNVALLVGNVSRKVYEAMKDHIVMRWHKYILGHQQQQRTKGETWFFRNEEQKPVPVRINKAAVVCECFTIWEFD